MRGAFAVALLLTITISHVSALNKEGSSFYKPFPGKCPSNTRLLSKWLELPHLCVSIENERVNHDKAAEICSKENKRSRLLTVGSLRKFQHVEMDYLTKDDSDVEGGAFWVDARYHGSGRWTNRRNKREVKFEYFPDFDPQRAHEGESLVWDPVEGRLRAAHPDENFRFICETGKRHVERCGGHPECSARGDCIEGECYCDPPFLGEVCEFFGCSTPCPSRQACDLRKGECECAPYLSGDKCTSCVNSRTRSDGSQVCYVVGPQGVPYATALAYCKGLSMRLPEITTAAQQTYVNEFAAGAKVWLGGTDLALANLYLWNSGTSVSPYSNWAGGLGPPNSDPTDNCVKMDSLGAWGNVGCMALKSYVCKIPWASAPASLNLHCATPKTDPCYEVVASPKLNYENATAACVSKGGILTDITSLTENLYISALLSGFVNGTWIGLQRNGADYFFENGKLLSSQLNWATGEPTIPSVAQNCMTLNGADGKWSNDLCNITVNTLCESPPF